MSLGRCFATIDELTRIYTTEYEARFYRVYNANVYVSYLTALFAIGVGFFVLKNLLKAKSGPIPIIVVSLEIASGLFVGGLAIIYTYNLRSNSLTFH